MFEKLGLQITVECFLSTTRLQVFFYEFLFQERDFMFFHDFSLSKASFFHDFSLSKASCFFTIFLSQKLHVFHDFFSSQKLHVFSRFFSIKDVFYEFCSFNNQASCFFTKLPRTRPLCFSRTFFSQERGSCFFTNCFISRTRLHVFHEFFPLGRMFFFSLEISLALLTVFINHFKGLMNLTRQ